MDSKRAYETIHKLALEYGLTDREVHEIVSYQFKFLKNKIRESSRKTLDYDTIGIIHIGKFYVPKWRREQEKKIFNESN